MASVDSQSLLQPLKTHHVVLSLPQYKLLQQRSPYFSRRSEYIITQLQNEKQAGKDHSNTNIRTELGITRITVEGIAKIKIKIQYPPEILDDPSILNPLFEKLTEPTIDMQTVITEFPDIQQLLLIIDYFQFMVWKYLFFHLLHYGTFRKENSFLKIILQTFPQYHIIVQEALEHTRTLLDIPVTKSLPLETPEKTVKYFRSIWKIRLYANIFFNYQCARCGDTFTSRRNLPHYGLYNGYRLHCCGTPTCQQCTPNFKHLLYCPYCNAFFTGTNHIDDTIDDFHVIIKRHTLRRAHGIPIDALLPQHPGTPKVHESKGPKFIF